MMPTFRRPALGNVTISVATSFYLLIFLNLTFWRKSWSYFADAAPERMAFAVVLLALFVAAATAISYKYLLKPILIAAILISAAASYFADAYGVVFDREMIGNIAATTAIEARQFVTPALVVHMAFYGILPSLLVVWVRVIYPDLLLNVVRNGAIVLCCLALAAGVAIANYAGLSSTIRERGDLLESSNPGGPLAAAVKFTVRSFRDRKVAMQPLGTDAHKGPLIAAARKPVLTIIVAGETARAHNFSLDGYPRLTNPELAKADVINFPHATSCGTATAVSLPCMFSVYSRADYTDFKGRSTENLMHVLAHAGIRLAWWDNNTGSKGIASLIHHPDLPAAQFPELCQNGECLDEILVEQLKPFLDQVTEDTVLVLHQIGSHGPSYHLRYPAQFARFKPDCQSAHFSDCSQEEIVNAYDNTILYTDHVLGQVIDLLKQHEGRMLPAMIYMSDHGESLGEEGLYLHGAPYLFAPEVQTHIPFVIWMSDAYSRAMKVDKACLQARAGLPVSHDNLFHTVLGMMDVRTKAREPGLDLLAACPARPSEVSTVHGRHLGRDRLIEHRSSGEADDRFKQPDSFESRPWASGILSGDVPSPVQRI